MKVGSLVFSTDQGLGILAKSFFDNGLITDVLVIRHGKHPEHDEWYPGATRIGNLRDSKELDTIKDFCKSMDVMLFLETPFEWTLLPFCRQNGVKTVIEIMYECMPKTLPAWPDLFICPSLLDFSYYPNGTDILNEMMPGMTMCSLSAHERPKSKSVFLPIPVEVPWKQRTRAEVFVHNAGHGGLKGRNGTNELVEALAYIKSPATIIIRSQKEKPILEQRHTCLQSKVDVHLSFGTKDYAKLWDDGDCLIFPEKFNGLSLPLQEACAAGMLVMSSDRFPVNTWLPREPLIPVSSYVTTCISPRLNEIQSAVMDPKVIAATIDRWFGADVSEYSLAGKRWAEEHSWAVLGPKYKQALELLL